MVPLNFAKRRKSITYDTLESKSKTYDSLKSKLGTILQADSKLTNLYNLYNSTDQFNMKLTTV